MPYRVEVKRIPDSDVGQIQMALAMGYVATGAPLTRRGRTYVKKTYISGPAKKKAVAVPAGGIGFDMSALSAALDDIPAQEWGGEGQIALEVNDADVDALIAGMGGVRMGGKRRRKTRKSKARKSKTRKH